MPIGCRGREPGGARLSILSPSRAWRESQSCGNWDTGGLGSARRDQSPRCAFVSTCGCVAVTCTPRVELRVLGFCPCLVGGKLSPEMKKPLPHGGGSLQGGGSCPVLKPARVGPLPQRQGNEGKQCPRAGTRGQGRGVSQALCIREHWRLCGVAAASRQHPSVSLLAAEATLSQAVQSLALPSWRPFQPAGAFPLFYSAFPLLDLVSRIRPHTRALVTSEPAPLPVGGTGRDRAGWGHGKFVRFSIVLFP